MRDYETIKGLLRGIAAGFRAKGNVHASKTCDDAADAIEELLARVAELLQKTKQLEDFKKQLSSMRENRLYKLSGGVLEEVSLMPAPPKGVE